MTLTRPSVAVIGILTLLPYAWVLLSMTYLLPSLMSAGQPGGIAADEYFRLFDQVWTTTVAMMLGLVVLIGIYCGHLYRSGAVPIGKRGQWALGLVFLGFAVMPAYWYKYMWRASYPESAPPEAPTVRRPTRIGQAAAGTGTRRSPRGAGGIAPCCGNIPHPRGYGSGR